MAEGNGVDLGSTDDLLAVVARKVERLDPIERDMAGIRRDVADLKHGEAALTQTVAQYHASVMGYGISITELDKRLRRVEQHLNLPLHS